MRKHLLWICGIIGMCGLCGCVPEEMDLTLPAVSAFHNGDKTPWGTRVTDPEPDNPYPLYVFPSLKQGAPDFALHLTNPQQFKSVEEFKKAPGHSDRLIVAAVYSTQCENCATHASYFERLAQQFQGTKIEFAILFADNDRDSVRKLAYVQNIQHVNIYYNSDNFCKNGLCMYPQKALTAWVADSKREMLTDTGFDDAQNAEQAVKQEEIYTAFFQLTKSFLNAHTSGGITIILKPEITYNFDIIL
jgi:thiol-disulfide isomerase/thioredoxin